MGIASVKLVFEYSVVNHLGDRSVFVLNNCLALRIILFTSLQDQTTFILFKISAIINPQTKPPVFANKSSKSQYRLT
ncbi:MAG: hypothetical protein RLZZ381_755 [Cyanobacteriota bacterium]